MLTNMSEAEWDAVIKVHLKGTFAPSRHAAAYWRDRSKAGDDVDARIINTTSPSGIYGNAGQTNYGAAKAGIASFTVIAAMELQRYGVTVNAIAPVALTRMTEGLGAQQPTPEQLRDREVEVVAVRQHEVEAAGRSDGDLGLHGLDADALDVGRARLVRELILALVDPLHFAVQSFQQQNDRATDMSSAVQLQGEERRLHVPPRDGSGVQRREMQGERPAAALAKRGPERNLLLEAVAGVRAGVGDGAQLEVAAADGAVHLVRADEHAGAGFAGDGPAGAGDFDDRGRSSLGEPTGGDVAQGHRRALTPALFRKRGRELALSIGAAEGEAPPSPCRRGPG
jgi:hypothetical protein